MEGVTVSACPLTLKSLAASFQPTMIQINKPTHTHSFLSWGLKGISILNTAQGRSAWLLSPLMQGQSAVWNVLSFIPLNHLVLYWANQWNSITPGNVHSSSSSSMYRVCFVFMWFTLKWFLMNCTVFLSPYIAAGELRWKGDGLPLVRILGEMKFGTQS